MNTIIKNLEEIFWEEKLNNIFNFSEQREISKFSTLIESWNYLSFIYIVLEWHFLRYEDDVITSIYSPWDVIWASVIFDVSKKTPIMKWDVIWWDWYNKALIVTNDEIKKLTENNTVFNWVVWNMKKEKNKI